jgi:prolyl-tRNA editing enzyme YbaK/EbsC (Cys-tRNA(Pro) deacylase)
MSESLSNTAQKVQNALNEHGLELNVVELSSSARTFDEAATAIGCEVSQIAKSLVFKGKKSQNPILIIASGTNRVNGKKVKAIIGEKIEKPDENFVLDETGFVVGGIPPVGHKKELLTLIDEDLMQFKKIWAAAGTPHAVFSLTPMELLEITSGEIINLK